MTDLLTARSGRVKAARRLTRRRDRAEHRLFLAEGAKAIGEALLLDGCVVEVFATVAATSSYDDLRRAVTDRHLLWQVAADDAVGSLSGTVSPPGVVAVCRFVDVPLAELADTATGPQTATGAGPDDGPDEGPGGFLAVCADVRDPGNAGTVIRTADAAGATGVVLAGHSVDPYNDKAVRATVGSLFHLPIALEPDPATVVGTLRDHGWTVLAADAAGETALFDADTLLTGKVAWLFGNEAWGLPADLAALADHRVAIPIRGRAESLNLATAAAVCLYATARCR
jgi:TrmH family RNA methyltransferase